MEKGGLNDIGGHVRPPLLVELLHQVEVVGVFGSAPSVDLLPSERHGHPPIKDEGMSGIHRGGSSGGEVEQLGEKAGPRYLIWDGPE